MTLNNDRETKFKLYNQYWQDMSEKVHKSLNDRNSRIIEEREHNDMINQELYNEKIVSLQQKKQIVSDQYHDYLRNLELYRIKKLREYQEKMTPKPVSLNLHSDERLNQFKGYITKLSNNVDTKLQYYKDLRNKTPTPMTRNYYQKDYPTDMIGIKRQDPTDITDKSIFDKQQSRDYNDYRNKHREYLQYNLQLSKDKEKSKERLFEINQLQEEQLTKERSFYSQFDKEAKQYDHNQKERYRRLLDEQRRYQIQSKLAKERYTVESAVRNPLYLNENRNQEFIDQTFLNRNQFVEVNPYNCKKYDLGDTLLNRNVILQPKFDYKHNRYMFPQVKRSASVLHMPNAGYGIDG